MKKCTDLLERFILNIKYFWLFFVQRCRIVFIGDIIKTINHYSYFNEVFFSNNRLYIGNIM